MSEEPKVASHNIAELEADEGLRFFDNDGGYWIITPFANDGSVIRIERREQGTDKFVAGTIFDGSRLTCSCKQSFRGKPRSFDRSATYYSESDGESEVASPCSDSAAEFSDQCDPRPPPPATTSPAARADDSHDRANDDDDDDDIDSGQSAQSNDSPLLLELDFVENVSAADRETTASTPHSSLRADDDALPPPSRFQKGVDNFPIWMPDSPRIGDPPRAASLNYTLVSGPAKIRRVQPAPCPKLRSLCPASPMDKVRRNPGLSVRGRGKDILANSPEDIFVDGFGIPRALIRPLEKRYGPELRLKRWKYPKLKCPKTGAAFVVRARKRGAKPWHVWCELCHRRHRPNEFLHTEEDALGLLWLITAVHRLPHDFPTHEFSLVINRLLQRA